MNEHRECAPQGGSKSWLRWGIWSVSLFALALACQPQPPEPFSPSDSQAQAIIGGKPDLRHPEVGALTSNSRTFCTGTLIAKRVVLTAAHCVDAANNYAKSAKVQFRIDTADSTSSTGYKINYFDFDVPLFKNHPKWNTNLQNGFDVGLGILKAAVTLVKPMPANLRAMGPEWRGRKLLFLGYGLIQSVPSSISPNRKYAVDLPITQLQADRFTHADSGKSVCHGDSGGPAVFLVDGRMRVLGVNSYVSAPQVPGGNRSTCSGTGTSMRTDTYAAFLASVLDVYGDGPETCKQNDECGQCGVCNAKNFCEAATISPATKACQPCTTDKDCGSESLCHRFDSGYRCLKVCNGKGCCPEKTYCSRERTHKGFQDICLPFAGQCAPHPCKSSKDCGSGEFCENGSCKPQPLAPSPELCKACNAHSECGQGGYCFGLEGHKRCTQPCSGGDFCPADTRCQEVAPGLPRQCVPIAGSCHEPCQFSSHCSAGFSCREGKCVSDQSGGYGAPCDPGFCKAPLSCVQTLTGKRCLQPCGVPPGGPGSTCRGNSCDPPGSCYSLTNERRLCLIGCQSNTDCRNNGGGFCSQGVCLCSSAADCGTDKVCNPNPGFSGACAPKSPLPPCAAGLTCKSISGDSFCVKSDPGERGMGQSCDALNRCRDGLSCIDTQDAGGVCFELCPTGAACRLGGQCTQSNGLRLCLCNDDNQCRTGRTCHIALRNRYGYCETQGLTNPCIDNTECPQGFHCTSGTCKPGLTPEHMPEPAPEPKAEPQPEPDAGPELAPEPTKAESKPEPTPEPKPEATATPEAKTDAAPKKGCGGCSATPGQRSPSSPWWLLAFVLIFLRRPQRSQHTETTPDSSKGLPPCA